MHEPRSVSHDKFNTSMAHHAYYSSCIGVSAPITHTLSLGRRFFIRRLRMQQCTRVIPGCNINTAIHTLSHKTSTTFTTNIHRRHGCLQLTSYRCSTKPGYKARRSCTLLAELQVYTIGSACVRHRASAKASRNRRRRRGEGAD